VASRIYRALQVILNTAPSASTLIHKTIGNKFPFMKNYSAQQHQAFLKAILGIIDFYPPITEHILSIAVDRLIQIDVLIKVEDIPDDDEEAEEDLFFPVELDPNGKIIGLESERKYKEIPVIAEKLDAMMDTMFQYICSRVEDKSVEESRELFNIILKVFDSRIIVTPQSKYTQFIIFYFLQKQPDFTELCGLLIEPIIQQEPTR